MGDLFRKALRKWLRKRLFFIAKLPLVALGFVAMLLTTDVLDTLKTVWHAAEVAVTMTKQHPKNSNPNSLENEYESH